MFLDLVVALVLAYAFYSGFSKGIIGTVFAIVSILIGILAAMKLSELIIPVLERVVNLNPLAISILAFVLTFIISIILIRFIGKKLEDVFEFANINFINKILGGFALTLLFAILIGHGYKGLSKIDMITEEQREASITSPILEPLPALTKPITDVFAPLVRNFWDKVGNTMDDFKSKSN